MSQRDACARKARSGVHASGSPCSWRACGCATDNGARVPIRASWKWTGATPLFRCPVRASRRVGMCTSRTPSSGGRSRPSVPAGRPTSTCEGLVPVLLGDAERPDGQPVGDRVLRRLRSGTRTAFSRRNNLRLGRALDPGGGTGGVRPGGRGDRRRCGGNADHAAAGHDADSREIDGLDRRCSPVGRRTSGDGPHGDTRPGGSRANSLTAPAAAAVTISRGSEGHSPPPASAGDARRVATRSMLADRP